MKKIALLVLMTVGTVLSGYGQNKEAEIKKLFSLMRVEQMIDLTMNNMLNMVKQQANSQFAGSDNKQQKYESYMKFVTEETKAMTKKVINQDMVGIYAKHFSETDIKEIIKFYESASGQKLLDKTPVMMEETMNSMLVNHIPAFQEKIKTKLEELNK